MNPSRLLLLFALGTTALLRAHGQTADRAFDFNRLAERLPQRAPANDAKQTIRESSSFLKEREPEMTPEEYALHEKVVTMMTTNPELAVRLLEAMVSEQKQPSPAFELILGNAYYAANQTERATKLYRSAVQRYPSFLRAWNNLGTLHYTAGNFDEAVKCFSKSVSLGDRDPTTFGLLGYSLEKQGDLVAAEAAYLQALSGAPSSSDWKEGLLRIYLDGKQYGRAEPLLRALIKAHPTETRFWLSYAGLLVADRRKTEAMAVLESARAVGAAGPDELALLGDLYAEHNLPAEAVSAYGQLLEPARARGEEKLLHFARVLAAAGRLDDAEKTLAALRGELTPTAQRALHQTRADLHLARKNWPAARREAEALLALAPLDGRALLTLGRTYAAEQEIPRATLAFESARRASETTYAASIELANIELRNRHYAKAAEHLEKALSLQRTDEVATYLARVRALLVPDSSPE
ncbi:MAG: tetratricopeptide repeat protein [Opitutae bacterium]|nr:tetratricopeptide repeat protein [Opitutae bacterium]